MSSGRTTVVVVEDEEDLATLVTLNLEIAGYDVRSAEDGQAGIDLVRAVRPDVVLLDVMMPRKDGWQVLRELKGDASTQDIPVVMLTALAEERDLIRGHLQGAVRYVTKPFEMRDLLEVVEIASREPDEAELEVRRRRTRELLQRLAELDSGRTATGPRVRFSRLEKPRPRPSPDDEAALDPARADELTEQQQVVARRLAEGVSARAIATELDVSRSNVYALRQRIARKLGVEPDDVADAGRELFDV